MSETGAINERERLDEDDHDLLTFTEAGERLRGEIATAQARVTELEAAGGDELAAARERLAALSRAALRNQAGGINDANFEKFFGYPGKARRNIPGGGGLGSADGPNS
ncbi:acyl-CoA synthetase [Mycobacterium sp. SMC-8]|uniref:acyl-CoA synthetase n=1 Tax=Mycobacterium sp. SMC-8 TaxID=2857060 RepID=UPI0021B19EB2|nr:acyl-CoA synthetase [Mycobacterium sp. SMC-8]UXA11562.1 acyl-CoA synthetase [Mycobacterium sp. SMC-8]